MSAFINMQAQKLLADTNAASTSKPSSARSSTNKSDGPSKAKGGSAGASQTSTPAATPPLKALKHAPPMPPLPAPKASPRRVNSEGKPPAVSGTTSAHSRSPSASSSNSDDDFVYMLDSVKTTAEAVERIRAVQQPKERTLATFFMNGLPGASSSNTNLAEMADGTPGKTQGAAAASASSSPPRKMKGGLPATMEEFYECPRYTVSLTAAREAIFSDALSGFHSYVERENAQREQLRALQHHHHHHNSQQPQKERDEGRGSGNAHALPSFSSGATEEWNVALAATTATTTTPSPETVAAAPTAPPASEATSSPLRFSDNVSMADAPVTSSSNASPSLAEDVTTVTSGSGKENDSAAQPLSASYMFIMRSRDTEAMSPVSSPRAGPQGREFSVLHRSDDEEERGNVRGGAPATTTSPLGVADPAASAAHADPTAVAAPATQSTKPTSPPKTAPDREQAAKLEAMQLRTLLQERIYQRVRVPVVFRCRYAAEFAETKEEHQQRLQMRERVLRHHERIAGPDGLSHKMRQRIRERYGDPNTVAPEWPYVWEQFVRDIPRETLFIEDTAHRDADDAIAAIMSYLEYCYDRGQRNVRERLDKALADAGKSGSGGGGEAGADAAAKAQTAMPEQQSTSQSTAPPAAKSRGFFESLFSAGSAAIKGAVVTVRASLPDFVGDPLLTVSGLDPALYHTSLLFPTDAKARSEKIFTAVREVVLASQQSFMGFPYQLLCEQVGTERLGLALEALEMDQEGDDDDDDAEGEKAETAAPSSATLTSTTRARDASAPIPIHKADDSDNELKRENSTSSMRSPMHNSRVLRIYQSFSSPTLLSDGAEGRRRHRGHSSHGIDEWNVSSSSSSSSLHTADVVCSPASPAAVSTTTTTTVTVTEVPDSTAAPAREAPPHPSSPPKTSSTNVGSAASEKSLLAAARPPPLQATPNDHDTAKPAPSVRLAQRRRERRRRRRNQLPLLVGEPRPHEFAIFLELVRARVVAKTAKEEKKARERQRRERVMRMVERQREQWHSAPGSRATSRAASSASLDTLHKAAAADASPIKAAKVFREDVEGSAYLLPSQPTAAQTPSSPLSSSMARQAMPAETRGMRICLFFDEPRNVPLVVVNKLFRLFTVPGLRGLTSSSDGEEQQQQLEPLAAHELAALQSRNLETGDVDRTLVKGVEAKHSERSLLLLIQVQFSLFTKEEAEVRWKWWKV